MSQDPSGPDAAEVPTGDAAGAWDARLRAPDCSLEDRRRFAEWRDRNPLHRATFEKLQLIVASLVHERSRADVRSLREEALSYSLSRRRLIWGIRSAAAAAVLALGVALWIAPDTFTAPVRALADLWQGAETLETGVGQSSSFVLRDGSGLELNARSRVRVAFNGRERRVELIEGQALFEVAKDAHRPFIVHAGDRDIVALGTQFDVRLDQHTVQVTLIEGQVRVDHSRAQEAVLTPGKQLIASRDPVSRREPRTAKPSVRVIDVAKVTAWRDGHVYLDDLTLDAAVAEMNKHSPVQIRLGDATLASLRINGMFRAGQQEAFVSALEQYFPIDAHRREDREIVLSARHAPTL